MVRGDPKLHLFNGWSRPHSTQDMTPSQHNNIRSVTLQLREEEEEEEEEERFKKEEEEEEEEGRRERKKRRIEGRREGESER